MEKIKFFLIKEYINILIYILNEYQSYFSKGSMTIHLLDRMKEELESNFEDHDEIAIDIED